MSKKEKCVNKKLHPYWKTGIYGWLGEEVDDNDYMCCPICGEILAMNYWDYSAEYDGDNKCFECGQELDYSEVYEFEDTLYFRQIIEMKDDKITNQEAKLAESEVIIKGGKEEIKDLHRKINEIVERDMNCIQQLKQQLSETDKLMQEYLSKCLSLEQQLSEKDAEVQSWKDGTMVVKLGKLEEQLAEKDQAIEGLQEINQSLGQTCNNDAKEIERLREQIAELKKGVYKVTLGTTPSNQIDFTENFYVIQNQTAIAVLEKLLKKTQTLDVMVQSGHYINQKKVNVVFKDVIDQQIKSLKGEK